MVLQRWFVVSSCWHRSWILLSSLCGRLVELWRNSLNSMAGGGGRPPSRLVQCFHLPNRREQRIKYLKFSILRHSALRNLYSGTFVVDAAGRIEWSQLAALTPEYAKTLSIKTCNFNAHEKANFLFNPANLVGRVQHARARLFHLRRN